MSREVQLAKKHVIASLKDLPDYGTKLPGGIWGGVAPDNTAYPHMIISFTDGLDVLAFSGGYAGTGMNFLIKVIDKNTSDSRAVDAFEWAETALLAANGTPHNGAWCWFDKRTPFHLPVTEDDVIYQQVGRTFNLFVDPM